MNTVVKSFRLIFYWLLVLSLMPDVVFAQEPLIIQRLTSPVIFDGIPDEESWQGIIPLPLVTYFPEDGRAPTEQSDVRIAHDDEYLYIGARLYDSNPGGIQAVTFRRNFQNLSTDSFGIILDTFNNNETAMAFFTTPTGARADFIISNDAEGTNPFNYDWDTFWDVETVQNEEGWFVEMRIPFSTLRFQSQNGRIEMGLTVKRWIARKNESNIFPAIPNNWGYNGHFKPSQTHPVVFENIDHRKPLHITPYLLGGFRQEHQLNENQAIYERDDIFTREAGLDIKYGLTGNLTLDLTFNTDFAQVEADDELVNLTRFNVFFPEKRRFFQERADLFDFSMGGPNRLFYSRRIGIRDGQQIRILGGARVTGSVGNWDMGFINMQTAREGVIPSENFGTIRLKRRVLNRHSFIGTMATSRIDEDGGYNYAYGLDGVIRLFGDDYITMNYAHSIDKDNPYRVADFDPTRLRFEWDTRRITGFGYTFGFSRNGPTFNPGMGFLPRLSYTRYGGNARYGWFSDEASPFRNHILQIGGNIFFLNTDGNLESINFSPQWRTFWKSGSQISINPTYNLEDLRLPFNLLGEISIPAGRYEFANIGINYNTPAGALINAEFLINAGQFFDGYRYSMSAESQLIVSRHFRFSPYYEINHLDFSVRNVRATTHIARMRMEYYFSTQLSMSTFVQYSNAADLVISNFRLRYNPREGNDLYIVVNENLITDRHRFSPVQPVSQSRAVMVKYTYTFNVQ